MGITEPLSKQKRKLDEMTSVEDVSMKKKSAKHIKTSTISKCAADFQSTGHTSQPVNSDVSSSLANLNQGTEKTKSSIFTSLHRNEAAKQIAGDSALGTKDGSLSASILGRGKQASSALQQSTSKTKKYKIISKKVSINSSHPVYCYFSLFVPRGKYTAQAKTLVNMQKKSPKTLPQVKWCLHTVRVQKAGR